MSGSLFPARLLSDGRDPLDVAREWVAVALTGDSWEARDSDGEPPAFVERGTNRDGDCVRLIEAELSYLDACIIEELLRVARGQAQG